MGQVQIEYLEMNTAVTIFLSLFGLVVLAAIYFLNREGRQDIVINRLDKENGTTVNTLDAHKELIEQLRTSKADLWDKINMLQKERTEDVLRFTEVIGKLNVTLSKTDKTLEHLNATIGEFKSDVRKDISSLNEKIESLKK